VFVAGKGIPTTVVATIKWRRAFIGAATREEAGRGQNPRKKERERVVACERR
jgi:hypothetical protein